MKFIYVDHSKKGSYTYRGKVYADGVIVFNCDADSILEADKAYKQTTGLDVTRQMSVGCMVDDEYSYDI